MPKPTVSQPLSPATGTAAPDIAARPAGFASAIERCALLLLRNPFLWLAAAVPLYLSLYLSFLQWRYQGFDHLELMAHLTALIQLGLLAATLILSFSPSWIGRIWAKRHPAAAYREMSLHLAAVLVIVIIAIIELLPTLIFHQYPQLNNPKLEVSINVVLMMLQRTILLVLMCLVTYNVIAIVKSYLRLPAWLGALIGTIWQLGMSYYLTYLSFTSDKFVTLNDVFYANQLWHYIDGFPNLQAKIVFHNMQWSVFFFFAIGIVLWLVTLFLLYPKAAQAKPIGKLS